MIRKGLHWIVIFLVLLTGCHESTQPAVNQNEQKEAGVNEEAETSEENISAEAQEEKETDDKIEEDYETAEKKLRESLEVTAKELGTQVCDPLFINLDSDNYTDLVVCTHSEGDLKTVWCIPGDMSEPIKLGETDLDEVGFDLTYTESGPHLIYNSFNSIGAIAHFQIIDLNGRNVIIEAEGSGTAGYTDDPFTPIQIVVQDYDTEIGPDGSSNGHSYKPTYLTYDDNFYTECAATRISEKEFFSIDGSANAIHFLEEEQKKCGASEVSFQYWYRSGGYIEIQAIFSMDDGIKRYGFLSIPIDEGNLNLEQRQYHDGMVYPYYTNLRKSYPAPGLEGSDNAGHMNDSIHYNLDYEGEVFPESSDRLLTWEDLNMLDNDPVEEKSKLLALAENEIYARHEYTFEETPWYNSFYRQFYWNYTPVIKDFSKIKENLNQFEIKNLEMLKLASGGLQWIPDNYTPLQDHQDAVYLDDLVGIRRTEHLNMGESDGIANYNFKYLVPAIKIESDDAKTYNQMLQETIDPYIEESMKAAEKGEYPQLISADYRAYVYNNMLTVISWIRNDWGMDIYYPITLDLFTGEMLDNEDIATMYHKDLEEINSVIYDTMETYFNNGKESMKSEPFYLAQLKKTLSKENIENAVLYPAADGKLFALCKIYSLVGADSYEHCLPLNWD